MNFCCNSEHTGETLLKQFENRLIDKDSFYFIPKFLKFQYPKGLNSLKPAIVSVRRELIEYDLIEIVRQSFGNDYLTVKDTDTDKDMDKDTDKDKGIVKGFIIPTPQEVEAYAKEQGFEIDGQKFVAHYGASNWMRGKTKITNWKLCAQTWKRTEKKKEVKYGFN